MRYSLLYCKMGVLLHRLWPPVVLVMRLAHALVHFPSTLETPTGTADLKRRQPTSFAKEASGW